MNVLIIGGTGVLSSAVVAEALKKGFSVTMINRGNRRIPEGVEHIKADKNDFIKISESLESKGFDAVIDFLCYTVEDTERSLCFYSHYTNQYIYISSCAVYNTKLQNDNTFNEDSPKVTKEWAYSVNKWESEKVVMSLSKEHGVNYTIIRPAITYDDTRIPYGIAPRYGYHWTLCARILAEKPIICWNGGVNCCNMMRVEDFAVGAVGLIGNPHAFNEAFNICGDEAPSWNAVLQSVGDALNKKIITVDINPSFYAKNLPSRAGEIIGSRAVDAFISNDKIKDVFPNFKQTITLKEGVSKTISAYKSLHFQSGIDWIFDAETDRIIKKWCKKERISTRKFKLHFINYLGTASLKDWLLYLYTLYKDSALLKCILRRYHK